MYMSRIQSAAHPRVQQCLPIDMHCMHIIYIYIVVTTSDVRITWIYMDLLYALQ